MYKVCQDRKADEEQLVQLDQLVYQVLLVLQVQQAKVLLGLKETLVQLAQLVRRALQLIQVQLDQQDEQDLLVRQVQLDQ